MKKVKENVTGAASSVDTDSMRRAAAFPVKGGDIVPFKRKSWFKTVDQKQNPRKQA